MATLEKDYRAVFRRLFPSDELPSFRKLLGGDLRFRKLLRIRDSIPVVVDSSQAIRDILWTAKTRKGDARTDLQEAIDSEVITAFAPMQLKDEVEEKIPHLAEEKKIPESALRSAWENIRQRLKFRKVTPRQRKRPVRDAKDLPFVDLARREKAAGVLTHDKDFADLGVRSITPQVLRKLRDYGRAKSVRVGAQLLFMGACAFGLLLLWLLLKPIVMIFQWLYERLGGWLWVLLGIAVAGFCIALWLSKEFRDRTFARARRCADFFGLAWQEVSPDFNEAAEKVAEHSIEEKRLWAELEMELKLTSQGT